MRRIPDFYYEMSTLELAEAVNRGDATALGLLVHRAEFGDVPPGAASGDGLAVRLVAAMTRRGPADFAR